MAKHWPLQLKAAETVGMGRLGHTTKKLVSYAAYDAANDRVQEVGMYVVGRRLIDLTFVRAPRSISVCTPIRGAQLDAACVCFAAIDPD